MVDSVDWSRLSGAKWPIWWQKVTFSMLLQILMTFYQSSLKLCSSYSFLKEWKGKLEFLSVLDIYQHMSDMCSFLDIPVNTKKHVYTSCITCIYIMYTYVLRYTSPSQYTHIGISSTHLWRLWLTNQTLLMLLCSGFHNTTITVSLLPWKNQPIARRPVA